MRLNPLKFLKKTEPVGVALVGQGGTKIDLETMRLENDFAHDFVKDRAYGPLKQPPVYVGGKPYFPFDATTGAPLWLSLDESVISCRTNPELIDRLIDRNLMANILQLDLSWTMTLVFGAFCGAVAWAISASVYG
jgi:hypothetical protein